MPVYLSQQFLEFPHGDILCHRFDFSIQGNQFLVLFSTIDVDDAVYHDFRSEEVGFKLPTNSYDVKFDRVENFDSGDFYKPPSKEQCGNGRAFVNDLADALETIIALHCNTYKAKAYFAVAESQKLKRFYDRILQTDLDHILCEATTDLGEEGKGYAFKTRYF
ncbi:hypothetical protein [Serratia sp. CC22-02]|uniref:hypothetical protein n=1 Tax=Serratia sp. CC22-02 TaxID=1378076 RepID=UPI0024B6460B|nr:hypothetical protein [Serratia sp. CC22-02]